MGGRIRGLGWLVAIGALSGAGAAIADAPFAEFVDPHPATGNHFGSTVVALSTGNIVITAPDDDAGGLNAGAVYLFNGANGALISTLRGSTAQDRVGEGGVVALTNGNYVILSPHWDGASTDVGAVTWGSGTTGIVGVVSAANSLVGSSADDRVGFNINDKPVITALTGGNYVVATPQWDGGAPDKGAVTWGNGAAGVKGLVSAANSLIGTLEGDQVGSDGVIALSSGNYVVSSSNWHESRGAVTWGHGVTGVAGALAFSNSLVGTVEFEYLGAEGSVTTLTNGNFVVCTEQWGDGKGSATWIDGTAGLTGSISAANSLVGTADAGAGVCTGGVTPLSNGNYVVSSPAWSVVASEAGAVTWANGTTGRTGMVSVVNSLTGSTAGDRVGEKVTALTNGNYVVASPKWSGTATSAGAATWADGSTGLTGPVTLSNSLVGSGAADQVGMGGVTALTNGNYVVVSFLWGGTSHLLGAVTWGSGVTGSMGVVSAANSLVGSSYADEVGSQGVTRLSNGHYVVASGFWDGVAANTGAVTWGNGTTGIIGPVTPVNSLVGSTADDRVGANINGFTAVSALSNGDYVVASAQWNGTGTHAGAVTWGGGGAGIAGVVSPSNSLVGSAAQDLVGYDGVTELSNGNYVVQSPYALGSLHGAMTWSPGGSGVLGLVSASNSLVGTANDDLIGSSGILALPNGNYVVSSPGWDGASTNRGAATWGSGTTGIQGAVMETNSLVGGSSEADLQTVGFDAVNGTFFAAFVGEEGGRVRLGSISTGGVSVRGLSIDDISLAEGNAGTSNAVFTVTLSSPSASTVTVMASTSNLTATAGSDYTATGPTLLTFNPGVTSQTFSVSILGDAVLESDETFQVTLSSPVNATILDGVAIGTIVNDEGASRVFVSAHGSDAGTCSNLPTPCRNLSAAMAQTAVDGEVIVLDAGEYDSAALSIVIGKGIKLTSPSGTVAFVRRPIVINAPGGRVVVRGLTLKADTAEKGVTVMAADAVSIEETTFDSWTTGLDVGTSTTVVSVSGSAFQRNTVGISVGAGTANVAIDSSRVQGNGKGLDIAGGRVRLRETAFTGNNAAVTITGGTAELHRVDLFANGTGVNASGTGTARIGRSHVFGNATGLFQTGGGAIESRGTNVVRGNLANTTGAIVPIVEQ